MTSTKDFDERQISLQFKYGHHAFSMSIFLSLLNACIKQYFNLSYASPVNECLIITFIPLAYFSVSAILTNSYVSFSRKRKLNIVVLADLVITFIAFLAYLIYKNGISDIIQNGLFSNWAGTLIICILNLIIIFAHVVRFMKDKKENSI